jgi:hypothetical protein
MQAHCTKETYKHHDQKEQFGFVTSLYRIVGWDSEKRMLSCCSQPTRSSLILACPSFCLIQEVFLMKNCLRWIAYWHDSFICKKYLNRKFTSITSCFSYRENIMFHPYVNMVSLSELARKFTWICHQLENQHCPRRNCIGKIWCS